MINAAIIYTGIAFLVLTVSCAPASCATQFGHGVIQSITIPDGFKLSNSDTGGSKHTVTFQGTAPGSTITFQTIRKPGRRASANFASLLKQPLGTLNDKQLALWTSVFLSPKSESGSESNYQKDAEPPLKDRPELICLSGRPAVRAFYSSYFYGCSRSAALNGDYKSFCIMVDASGDGTIIERIDLTSKAADFEKLKSEANNSLQTLKWKAINAK